jgi:hypothetical protein
VHGTGVYSAGMGPKGPALERFLDIKKKKKLVFNDLILCLYMIPLQYVIKWVAALIQKLVAISMKSHRWISSVFFSIVFPKKISTLSLSLQYLKKRKKNPN